MYLGSRTKRLNENINLVIISKFIDFIDIKAFVNYGIWMIYIIRKRHWRQLNKIIDQCHSVYKRVSKEYLKKIFI